MSEITQLVLFGVSMLVCAWTFYGCGRFIGHRSGMCHWYRRGYQHGRSSGWWRGRQELIEDQARERDQVRTHDQTIALAFAHKSRRTS